MNDWLHEYTILNLRLNKLIADQIGDDTLLDYYGPPALKTQVDQEPTPKAEDLVQTAQHLAQSVNAQGFEPSRARFLKALLIALETVSRRVAGEVIPLRQQARLCFDLHVDYTPETQFELAYSIYDQALRGSGNLNQRLDAWRTHHTLSSQQTQALPELIQQALNEARRRTSTLVEFSSTDEVSIESIEGMPIRAMAWYLGNHKAKILINPAYPFNLADLLYVICHESYPGHLAEAMLKERHLIQQGILEQQVNFLLTPPLVISEGLALWAHELIFPNDQAATWLTEHVYPKVGIVPDGSQLRQIHRATDMLWAVRCNAALMLEDGCSEPEVLRYLMQYALLDETAADRALKSLQRTYCEAYIFTYDRGRKLLESSLKRSDQDALLKRLLTQQVLPSDLLDEFEDD
jgi:hypothetical protein